MNLIIDFLNTRERTVVLNSQYSSWASVKAKVPQGSILGPLFLSIIINGLSYNLVSTPKLFVDDWVVKNDFNLDHNKQSEENTFS